MEELQVAADLIHGADAILVTAGAGMSVDSGLPDFRGDQGFWKAYPPYKALGLGFTELSSPDWFRTDPALAWGFYGHRRNLYRSTEPHDGYRILRELNDDIYVVTSNVDAAFLKAGFNAGRVVETHGSIEWNQCLKLCGVGLFPAGEEAVDVDSVSMRAGGDLPSCPACGGVARPNIQMFGDPYWDKRRADAQLDDFYRWLTASRSKNVVVIECGAGIEIPSIRERSEEVIEEVDGSLVRINPAHASVPTGQIGLALGALDALTRINLALSSRS